MIIADPLGLWARVLRGAWILWLSTDEPDNVEKIYSGLYFSVCPVGAVSLQPLPLGKEERAVVRVPLQGVAPLLEIWR